MKRIYKAALLAALGLAGVSAAQAQTEDVLLGFNDAAGPTSAQNDYVIDLGYTGSGLVAAAIADGGSIDLSSTFSASLFSSAFSTDPNYLADVAMGAVSGSQFPIYPESLYQTVKLNNISRAQFNNATGLAGASDIGKYASTSTTGWTAFISPSPSQTVGGTLAQYSGNPLELIGGGFRIEELYETSLASSGGTPTAPVDVGHFTFDLGSDSVIFSVPEPSTYALATCASLLALSLRRKFIRNNA
jgi:hypothetical protein